MLVDFEVENFRSFRGARTLSLVASSAKELPLNLIRTEVGLELVRTAALYGPNASGKSNLLAGMNRLAELLVFPMNRGLTAVLLQPFALDRRSSNKAIRFAVRFLLEDILYHYTLTTRKEVVEEERLTAYPHGRPQQWFDRKGSSIDFNQTHLKGQKQTLRSMTPIDTPLLAIAAAFDHPQLAPVARWLIGNLSNRFDRIDPRERVTGRRLGNSESTARLCHVDGSFRSWVNAFLRHADLGIREVTVDITAEKYKRPIRRAGPDGSILASDEEIIVEHHEPYFVHAGDEDVTARFAMRDESQGTRRLFAMLAPLYEVLRKGHLALIDEFSASLHPSLVREIIRAFHEPELNPAGAQLVFATHDTSLLSGKLFRRDQVWFTEKDASGATDLYSLNDIKGVREDESFEKGYLRGRYGAIPFFGSFDFPPVSEEPAEAAP